MCKGEIFLSYELKKEDRKKIFISKAIKVNDGLSAKKILELVKKNILKKN